MTLKPSAGNIAAPFTVPGTGEAVNLPLQISFDFLRYFKENNYESILNLLLNIGGRGGSASRLTVFSTAFCNNGIRRHTLS
jgi:hypothetical protein